MWKVTQTYEHPGGGEAARPRKFATLEEAGKFISEQRAWDVENVKNDKIRYQLFESGGWAERKFELAGIRLLD